MSPRTVYTNQPKSSDPFRYYVRALWWEQGHMYSTSRQFNGEPLAKDEFYRLVNTLRAAKNRPRCQVQLCLDAGKTSVVEGEWEKNEKEETWTPEEWET